MKFSVLAISSLSLAMLCVTAIASGDESEKEQYRGYVPTLDSERLPKTIHLSCGATITEWRGLGEHDANVPKGLCALADREFVPFVKQKGFHPITSSKLNWSLALLPPSNCYRCLNDTEYRFYYRTVSSWVSGYTSFTNHYTFVVDSTTHPEFKVTFTHELFHAMSWHYGIFQQYPEEDFDARVEHDEAMAEEFTERLGLGK